MKERKGLHSCTCLQHESRICGPRKEKESYVSCHDESLLCREHAASWLSYGCVTSSQPDKAVETLPALIKEKETH
eukprot:286448-Pelagomonas_calceolata.AAC.2